MQSCVHLFIYWMVCLKMFKQTKKGCPNLDLSHERFGPNQDSSLNTIANGGHPNSRILKKKTARNRWFLAYTLIKNEELITLRWHRRKLRWKQEEIERKKAEARAEKLKRNSLVKNVKRTLSSFIKEIILSQNLTDKFTGIYVGTLVDTLTDISRHFIENEPKMTTSERLYLLRL